MGLGFVEYNCDICEKIFTQEKSIKVHLKAFHIQLVMIRCDYCENTYNQPEVLKTHMKNEHDKDNIDITVEKYFKAIEKIVKPVNEINVEEDQINPPNKKRKIESSDENKENSTDSPPHPVAETEKGNAAEELKPVQEKEPETQDENGEITIVQEGKTVVPRELIDLTKDDEPTLPRATFKCKSCFNEFDSSDDIIEHHLEKHVTVFEL